MNLERARTELQQVAEQACELAKKAGAQHTAAAAMVRHKQQVVIRDGLQEELNAAANRKLTLMLYVGGRYGSHSTSSFDRKSLAGFVDRAIGMTRLLTPDPHRALADPALYRGRSTADLGLFDPGHQRVTIGDRKQRATTAHDAARRAAGSGLLSVGAGATDTVEVSLLRTSNGFSDSERRTEFWLWTSVSLKDPSGRRPSAWEEAGARRVEQLDSASAVGQRAAERTRAMIGATKISSTTLPLIVENRAVGRLMSGLLQPLSAWALDQKRSCFAGALGQRVGNQLLTIVDDPLLSGGWRSRRYDGDGIAAARRPLFNRGRLAQFVIDNYYGRKIGQKPTGNGTTNVVMQAGSDDLSRLCRKIGKGLLVTGFIGGNANSTTGDFSYGIEGFLIEGGVRREPVASLNLSGNHRDFWKRLRALGADAYPHSRFRTPSLLFDKTRIAGK